MGGALLEPAECLLKCTHILQEMSAIVQHGGKLLLSNKVDGSCVSVEKRFFKATFFVAESTQVFSTP